MDTAFVFAGGNCVEVVAEVLLVVVASLQSISLVEVLLEVLSVVVASLQLSSLVEVLSEVLPVVVASLQSLSSVEVVEDIIDSGINRGAFCDDFKSVNSTINGNN